MSSYGLGATFVRLDGSAVIRPILDPRNLEIEPRSLLAESKQMPKAARHDPQYGLLWTNRFAIHLVSLCLKLLLLVVVLDTEASYDRKPVGSK